MIRARRAQGLGLVDMLMPDEADDPAVMAEALRQLAVRAKPSETAYGRPLDGLLRIGDLVHDYISAREDLAASLLEPSLVERDRRAGEA